MRISSISSSLPLASKQWQVAGQWLTRASQSSAPGFPGRLRLASAWLAAGLWRLAIGLAALVCVILELVLLLTSPLIQFFDAILGWAILPATALLELALTVPYLGRILGWLWRGLLSLLWGLPKLLELPLVLLAVMPPRRLRVWVAPTGDFEGVSQSWHQAIEVADKILRREANVRLVPVRPMSNPFNLPGWQAAAGQYDWVQQLGTAADQLQLDVGCNQRALKEDLGSNGGRLDRLALQGHPRGSYRRLTGWGAPIMALVVHSVSAGKLAGCSLGPLTDYITVRHDKPVCLAHELGHACNLIHSQDPNNLMNPTCGGVHLSRWQVLVLRLSRHVTYW